MFFFKRKKDQPRPVKPPTSYHVSLSGRDYDQLAECDTALKFWLPESIEKKIDEMCSFMNTSASDLVRQILFIHLYGRYDLFGLIERQIDTFGMNQLKFKHNMFSRSCPLDSNGDVVRDPETVEKSIADFKVWIPAKMKADIQALAQKTGNKPSLYVRQVIITHLFGHVPPEGISLDMLPPNGYVEDAP